MTLGFPNRSRSFDAARDAVRFIAHDGMFEVPFYVEAGALRAPAQNDKGTGGDEAACLAVFDSARTKIQEAASKAYSGTQRGKSYVLTRLDLRIR
ncbi:DUF1488 family protein [Oryzicola mucosus]|uniref:DUF1488 domain-containing protein n=1 Tax=Oryzicola mucosus TaxID=2767425 RepID=A0A8J6PL98_9HYPH|nr:DUF1488 domain-containing protein [Oryzicola mucosus]MBD0413070.1 DUF1488 domain-containing protein [Oryzicola mucosus]